MDPVRQDIAYAVRKLLGNPGFALTAILTLGIGIGANTAIFSLVDALFLSPPAAVAPERLVGVVAREGARFAAQQLTWVDPW